MHADLPYHNFIHVYQCFFLRPLHRSWYFRYVTSAKSGNNVEAAFLDLVERSMAHDDEINGKGEGADGSKAKVRTRWMMDRMWI